ncbi:permease-like cell division protein FtsX [Caldanaerobius polysaccharolyticus]|uniref:permease-like cell division protein FtsX n=1 Tax=Caldanaerobius polysaccharolyticus TaxID=44256 RepID=UPI00047EC020|nr:permease-like cell division protein FtsX [Caldanaerobius polysaccharolyticus]
MKLKKIRYFITEGFINMWRNRAMAVAAVTAVVVSLIVLGVFTVIVMNVDHIATQVESELVLRAYINDSVKAQEIDTLKDQIDRIKGVKSISYESRQAALENYKKQLGKNAYLLNGLEKDNPFPRSFIIEVTTPNDIKPVASAVSAIKGISEVNYGREVVDKLLKITRVVRLIGIALIGIMAFVAIIIISNTIKLAVYARRREINIMKYIGATDWFIRWPFVIEGFLLGLLGSVLAIVIVGYGYYYFTSRLNGQLVVFSLIPYNQLLPGMAKLFVILGCAIGGLGSGLSVRRFLKV